MTTEQEKAVKLNDNEKAILVILSDGYDSSGWDETGFYPFVPLMRLTNLDKKQVRLACRSLTRKGLAKFSSGLWNDDGPAGAGYGATRKGAALITPCDDCGDLATYDWWSKNDEIVFPNTDGATRFRKCETHYKHKFNLYDNH